MTRTQSIITVIASVVIATIIAVALAQTQLTFGADFPSQYNQSPAIASSTTYTLTGGVVASTRIVATSSTADAIGGRTGLTVENVFCGTSGHVWLNFGDVASATGTIYHLAASTTVTFGDTLPMVYGSIRASASTANCTVKVIEWRSEQ